MLPPYTQIIAETGIHTLTQAPLVTLDDEYIFISNFFEGLAKNMNVAINTGA